MRGHAQAVVQRKNHIIRVQVSQRTKAALEDIANAECRPVSNLCYFILEKEGGTLQLGNDEGTPRAASAPVSPDPRTVRINIRCERQWKEDVQRQAKFCGQTLSAYCNHLLERFTAARLTARQVPDLSLRRRGE